MYVSKRLLRALPAALLALALSTGLHAAAATVPGDLEARRAELASLGKIAEAREPVVGPLANRAIARVPEFSRRLKALHRIPLTEAERRVLLSEGSQGLTPEKAAEFQAAAPSFQAMKEVLADYFEAYDAWMDAVIQVRTLGAVLAAHERRSALEPHLGEKERAALEASFGKLRELEADYRNFLADPGDDPHLRPDKAKTLFFAADDLDEQLLELERRYGLAPKPHWGKKVGSFFRSLKRKARLLKINALALPAAARLFTHVFLRPFWTDEHDPEKTSDLIRFYSRSYRWAAGMELNVTGQDGIPEDAPVVFALSHRATIEDAMTMTAVVPGKYSFMWAADAMPGWLEKRLVADPTVIAVGGTNEDGTRVDAVEESLESLRRGQNLALFPEGNVPTPAGETRPLRSGLDVITSEISEKPVYIVPITIDDTAAGWDAESRKRSHTGKLSIDVTVGAPIDPLRLKSVPGADKELLLNVVRGIYHRNLYRKDVDLNPPACEQVCDRETLGVIPDARRETFQSLHN